MYFYVQSIKKSLQKNKKTQIIDNREFPEKCLFESLKELKNSSNDGITVF
jgi:hypothetical protein